MKILTYLFLSTLLLSNSCKKEKPAETATPVVTEISKIENTEKMEEPPIPEETKPEMQTNVELTELKGITIAYEATTRGFQMYTTIANGKFMVQHGANNKAEEVKISLENWKKIAVLYSKVDLAGFEKLTGATKDREFDGKAHGNLTITKLKKTYSTLGFDHTVPPAKIKELVDLIVQLSEKKE